MQMMLSSTQRDLVRDKGTKFGRFLMGLLFFAGGMNMLLTQTPAGVADMFSSVYQLPFPLVLAYAVIALKIVAGLAIILGYRVGLAAAALIGFTAAATMIAHRDFADPNLLKNLAIIGGLMYLMAYGPGGMHTKRFASTLEDMDGNGVPDEHEDAK